MNQHFKTTALTIAVACVVVCLPQKGVAGLRSPSSTLTLTLTSEEGKIAGDKLQKRLDVIRTEMDKLTKTSRTRITTCARASASERGPRQHSPRTSMMPVQVRQKAQVYQERNGEMQGAARSHRRQDPLGTSILCKRKAFTLVIDLLMTRMSYVTLR
jgi:hypothetical protein